MERKGQRTAETCVVHISDTKTEAGERTIPMIDEVYDAFLEEYQIQQVLGFGTNEIDGYTNFVFSTSEGNVYTPESVNRAIKRIYEDYNKVKQRGRRRKVGSLCCFRIFLRIIYDIPSVLVSVRMNPILRLFSPLWAIRIFRLPWTSMLSVPRRRRMKYLLT